MAVFTEEARAKINLTLRVLGRRLDGYHQIESLVAFASVGDVVTLDTSQSRGVETSGLFASRIEGPNLAEAALAACAEAEPRLILGRVRIDKHLPVAAGIGGGSADAAAVLRAVRRANPGFEVCLPWARIAQTLGADVPVCLTARPAIMRGTGEEIALLPGLPRLEVVLANPLTAVPADKTARVFRLLQAPALASGGGHAVGPLPSADRTGLLTMMRAVGNDLFAPACQVAPDIVGVIAALEATSGIEHAQLSGAGPTCFGVYSNRGAAIAAQHRLQQEHPGWWVAAASLG